MQETVTADKEVVRQYLVGPLDIWCISTKNMCGGIDLGVYIAADVDHKLSTSGLTAMLLHEPMNPFWGARLVTSEPSVWMLPYGNYRHRRMSTGHAEPVSAFDWFVYCELDSFAVLSDFTWCELPFAQPLLASEDIPAPYERQLFLESTYATGADVNQIQSELDVIEDALSSLLIVWRTLQAQREHWLLDWYSHNGQLPADLRRAWPGDLKT